MTDTAPARTGRGRPREFDADAVLDQLVQLFWEQGFEATSIADIVAATGLNKSSLYNAFGSKEELFGRVLTRYMELRAEMLREIVVEGTGGIDDVLTLIGFMQAEITSDTGGRGCLAVNVSTELGLRDDDTQAASRFYRDTIRAALTSALTRAGERGEIEAGSVATYVDVLLPWMLGMAVVARAGADHSEVAGHFDAVRAMLAGWRIDR